MLHCPFNPNSIQTKSSISAGLPINFDCGLGFGAVDRRGRRNKTKQRNVRQNQLFGEEQPDITPRWAIMKASHRTGWTTVSKIIPLRILSRHMKATRLRSFINTSAILWAVIVPVLNCCSSRIQEKKQNHQLSWNNRWCLHKASYIQSSSNKREETSVILKEQQNKH